MVVEIGGEIVFVIDGLFVVFNRFGLFVFLFLNLEMLKVILLKQVGLDFIKVFGKNGFFFEVDIIIEVEIFFFFVDDSIIEIVLLYGVFIECLILFFCILVSGILYLILRIYLFLYFFMLFGEKFFDRDVYVNLFLEGKIVFVLL